MISKVPQPKDDAFPYLSSIEFTAEVMPAPWECLEDYVHEIEGTLWGLTREDEEEIEFGKIELLRISATEAINRGMSLFEVCDAHSQFLTHVFEVLFAANEETKDEFDITIGWNDLLIISNVVIADEYRRPTIFIAAIETAINFIGPSDLIVAPVEDEHYHGLHLDTQQWRALGFQKVAGTGLAFRDTLKRNPYQ